MKTAKELVDFAASKIGTNYVYGMKGTVLTKSKFDWLKKTYPNSVPASDEKKIGTVCVDCSGLLSWLTGVQRNSGGYKSTATKELPINDIAQAVPGCALWRSGHIGIYIGNGRCIEARGSKYGVVETKVADRDFTHILWLKDIDYTGVTVENTSKYRSGTYQVIVGSLNRRRKPDPDSALAGSAIHKGDQINVTKIENNAWGYAENLGAWVNVSDMYCKYLGAAEEPKKEPAVGDLVKVSGNIYSNKNGGNSVNVNRELYIVKIYATGKYPYTLSKTRGGAVYGFASKEVLQ